MTSKEKLQEIHSFIDNIANKLSIIDYLCYQHYLDDIQEDLEILDILKGVIFLTNNSYYIQTKKRLNEEDYKLIKEYLENDN